MSVGSTEPAKGNEDEFVVDPHDDPPIESVPVLHHAFVVDEDRIVELWGYPTRRAAFEAVGL